MSIEEGENGGSQRRWNRQEPSDEDDMHYEELLTAQVEEGSSEHSSLTGSPDSFSVDSRSIWGVSTNVLFFSGSVLYVWLAVWDLKTEDSSSDEYDDEYYDDDTYENINWDLYTIISAVAASTYVLSSVIGFYEICFSQSSSSGEKLIFEIAPAVTFGIAAACELFGVLLQDDSNPQAEYAASTASVQIYLLEAILALSGERLSLETVPVALVTSGNILFLLGCIIDVVLSYFSNPDTPDSAWHMINCWSLVSAVSWLVDSILYLVSDYLVCRSQNLSLESHQVPLVLSLPREEFELLSQDEG